MSFKKLTLAAAGFAVAVTGMAATKAMAAGEVFLPTPKVARDTLAAVPLAVPQRAGDPAPCPGTDGERHPWRPSWSSRMTRRSSTA